MPLRPAPPTPRQAIVLNALLWRVISAAMVMANSVSPLGALTFLIALTFSCTALGHTERYLPGARKEEPTGALTPVVP